MIAAKNFELVRHKEAVERFQTERYVLVKGDDGNDHDKNCL